MSDRITAYALYTDPPLGRAGMTEAEIRKSERPAPITTMPIEDVSRAYEKGETKSFTKILIDKESKQNLGASFVGLADDEVIHGILDLIYAKAPHTVMQRAMRIHATVSELIPTMMGERELRPLSEQDDSPHRRIAVRRPSIGAAGGDVPNYHGNNSLYSHSGDLCRRQERTGQGTVCRSRYRKRMAIKDMLEALNSEH